MTPGYDDDKCDLCPKGYALFIKFPTEKGSKNICGDCRRKALKWAGQYPNGTPYPKPGRPR